VAEQPLSIVVKAIDQATRPLQSIDRTLGGLNRTVDRIDKATGRLRSGFNRLNAVLQGAGIGVGFSSYIAIERAIGRLIRTIPDAIGRGEKWAATVRDIASVSGLAAEKASALGAAAQYVGVSSEEVVNALSRMRREGMSAEQSFTMLTRGLGLTSAQLKLIIADAQRSGLILDEAALRAAMQWEQTKNRMTNAMTGVGSQILSGVAPALEALVDGITNSIQQNMDNIVRFAVQVVNFIAGLVSGFLNINLSMTTFADKVAAVPRRGKALTDWLDGMFGKAKRAKSGIDGTTSALEKQIKAIDRQIEALDRQERRRNAARERQELVTEIEEARRQLEDLKTKGVFTAFMGEAEAELARQKHAADIIEGERNVAKAKERLAEHERQQAIRARRDELMDRRRHLQDLLAEHRKHLAQIGNQIKAFKPRWPTNLGTDFGAGLGKGLTEAMKQAAAEARKSGEKFAADIKSFLFGHKGWDSKNPWAATEGTPGLFDKIGSLVSGMSGLVGWITDLLTFLKTELVDKIVAAFRSLFPEGSRPLGPGTPSVEEVAGGGLLYLLARKLPLLGGLIQGAEKGVIKGGSAVAGLARGATPAAGGSLLGLGGLARGLGAGLGLGALQWTHDNIWPFRPMADPSWQTVYSPSKGYTPPGRSTSIRASGQVNAFPQSGPTEGERWGRAITDLSRNLGPGGLTYRQLYDQAGYGSRTAESGETTADKVTSGLDANVTQKPGLPWNIEHPAFGPMRTSMDGVAANTGPLKNGRLGIDGNTSTGTVGVTGSQLGSIATHTQPLANGRLAVEGALLNSIEANTGPMRKGALDLSGAAAVRLAGINDMTRNTSTKLDSTGPLYRILQAVGAATQLAADRIGPAYAGRHLNAQIGALRAGFSKVRWNSSGPTYAFAQGGAGYTNGPMNAVLGEAAQEAYAILRNPREISGGVFSVGGGGGGGGNRPIEVHTSIQLNGYELARAVTEGQQRHLGIQHTGRNSSTRVG
jgi:hypothetical protein